MEDIQRIKEKINIIKKDITFIIDNDFQYYFFIGQLAYFIEYESKVDIEACLESVEKYEDKNSSRNSNHEQQGIKFTKNAAIAIKLTLSINCPAS